MSRFDSEGEEWFPNQYWLWEANLRRTVNGKAGQEHLRGMREALLALPEHKLISSRLATKEGAVCAVGAYHVHVRTQQGFDRADVLADLDKRIPHLCENCIHEDTEHEEGRCKGKMWSGAPCSCTIYEEDGYHEDGDLQTMYAGREVGMTETLAWHMGSLNDRRGEEETPQERYDRILTYLNKVIIEPVRA